MSNPTLSTQEIDSWFTGTITPVKVTTGYRIALALVAIAMIILPLIYLSIIGLVGYGIFYHCVNNLGFLRVSVWLYLTPIAVGVILLVFLIKPLFAKHSDHTPGKSVTVSEQPQLFHFVERICTVVSAPMPAKIVVDLNPNASASFTRGMRSLFSNELTLTLGLPLAAATTVEQFGGVIAHEFGHFAQRAGMRFAFIIRSISRWFTVAVYGRDDWDELLSERSALFMIASVFVWITRGVLWLLMMIGHLVSSTVLRQMEYDADRYEVRLVGQSVFSSTFARFDISQACSSVAFMELRNAWAERKLADNFVDLVAHRIALAEEESEAALEHQQPPSKAGWLDTHPSPDQRIARVKTELEKPILQCPSPTEILFADFEGLSKAVTLATYTILFGQQMEPHHLVATGRCCKCYRC